MPRNATHHRDSIVIFSVDSYAANQLAQQFGEKGYRTFIQSSFTESAQWRFERLALIMLLNCKDICASSQHYLAQIKRDSSNVPIVCIGDTIPPPGSVTVDVLADSSDLCHDLHKLLPEADRQQPGQERRRYERRLSDRQHVSHAFNYKQLNQVQSENPLASLIPTPPRKASHAPIHLLIISKSQRLIEIVQASCRLDPDNQVDIAWLADPLPASGSPTQPQPDLVLLDTVAPECRMIRLLRAVRNQYPTAKIILLQNLPSPSLVHHIVEFRICGLLPRDARPEVYRKALQVVHNGELWLPHFVINQVFAHFSEEYLLIHQTTANAPTLTTREQAVAALIVQGWTNKEIARKLDISPETVKKHLKNIFQKLDTPTRGKFASKYVAMVGHALQRLV